MLYAITGPVDFNSALVLVAFFACVAIVLSILVTRKTAQDYKIEEMKLEQEAQFRKVQLERGLITSHRENDYPSR